MTTFTTTYYAYDKSHRMTKQYVLGGEAHYFTYNERDMIASIQDFNGAGDANRYFTYNGVGERVLMRDSASNLSYLTYDGSKLLTEKTETGKVYGRYRHNMSVQDRVRGSGLEFTVSDGTNTKASNPAFDHIGNTRTAYSNEAANVSYVYDVNGRQLLAPGGVASGSALTTSRLQGLTGLGFQQLTTTEALSMSPDLLFLQTQAVYSLGVLLTLDAVSGLLLQVAPRASNPLQLPQSQNPVGSENAPGVIEGPEGQTASFRGYTGNGVYGPGSQKYCRCNELDVLGTDHAKGGMTFPPKYRIGGDPSALGANAVFRRNPLSWAINVLQSVHFNFQVYATLAEDSVPSGCSIRQLLRFSRFDTGNFKPDYAPDNPEMRVQGWGPGWLGWLDAPGLDPSDTSSGGLIKHAFEWFFDPRGDTDRVLPYKHVRWDFVAQVYDFDGFLHPKCNKPFSVEIEVVPTSFWSDFSARVTRCQLTE